MGGFPRSEVRRAGDPAGGAVLRGSRVRRIGDVLPQASMIQGLCSFLADAKSQRNGRGRGGGRERGRSHRTAPGLSQRRSATPRAALTVGSERDSRTSETSAKYSGAEGSRTPDL